MLDIFISYSRDSQAAVKILQLDFESLGHGVWFDQDLAGGKVWWDNVLEQIRECTLFVYALSPTSLDSLACKNECNYAFSLNKTILPILLTDVSVNLLPSNLSVIQYVDYRLQDRDAAFSLVKALQNLPEPVDMPDPLPVPPEVPISYLGNLKDEIESTSLNFGEQTALVVKLKERLRDVNEREDALTLLSRLRTRDDLFAKVAEEIDNLLDQAKATTSKQDKTDQDRSKQINMSSTTSATSEVERTTDDQRWQALFEKVKETVVEQLGVDASEVKREASFFEDLGADSLDTVELVMAFEEAFGAEIADEDAEKLTTVGKVVDYIYQRGFK